MFHLLHLWEKKEIPGIGWHGMAGIYSKGGLRICVDNGATREWPFLHGRADRNRIAVHDLATFNDSLRLCTMYN